MLAPLTLRRGSCASQGIPCGATEQYLFKGTEGRRQALAAPEGQLSTIRHCRLVHRPTGPHE